MGSLGFQQSPLTRPLTCNWDAIFSGPEDPVSGDWGLGTGDPGTREPGDPGPKDSNWYAPYMYKQVSLNAQLEYVGCSSGTGYKKV